jgi:hypothetical protein
MATVFLARDVRHDRTVALKVFRPELAFVERVHMRVPGVPPSSVEVGSMLNGPAQVGISL